MEGIKNYTEDIVESMLDTVLEQYPNLCKCEHCRKDVAALALNNLPPHYGATDKGKVMIMAKLLALQNETDVITAIASAAQVVVKNVRHE